MKNWHTRKPENPDEDIHVYPNEDIKEHALTMDCWCKPKIEQDLPPYLIVHNSADKRELKEWDYKFNTLDRC